MYIFDVPGKMGALRQCFIAKIAMNIFDDVFMYFFNVKLTVFFQFVPAGTILPRHFLCPLLLSKMRVQFKVRVLFKGGY